MDTDYAMELGWASGELGKRPVLGERGLEILTQPLVYYGHLTVLSHPNPLKEQR